ncbi:hypothetical protein AS033_01585 [Exiguobacterium indicum]|uniref:Competence protein ComF n=2 Tax=Exiguobacterium indicum TaxID=296995 RepID=A0A0V8GIJ0_9BACL|nr:hypothetical protein AS033_01585 [Exiguobacterium enclense]
MGNEGSEAMDIRGRWISAKQMETRLSTHQLIPAVTFTCQRCGAFPVKGPCTCGKRCYYCRQCIAYGKLRTCDQLITDTRPLDPVRPAQHRPVRLTPAQTTVARTIEQTILRGGRLLVHAVCGAGKTPMFFPGIERALANGKRVLVTAPRADVVRELTHHIKQAFPTAHVVSLYGGSADRLLLGEITVSTTHQLIHYRSCFDVVLLDEVDAFPFHMNWTLHRYVKRAMTQKAALILLSATPSMWHRRYPTVRLMRRYHGHPLPVPRLKSPFTMQSIVEWLRQYEQQPRLVFVPRIAALEAWQTRLKEVGIDVTTVHAEDPDRIEKIQAFRTTNGILLTTTILERGVTISNVQVAVLDADQGFSTKALIQISGRVGRDAAYPDGDISFFANDRSDALFYAIHQIQKANRWTTS